MSECMHRNVAGMGAEWFCTKCLLPFTPVKTPEQERLEYARIKKLVERMLTEGIG